MTPPKRLPKGIFKRGRTYCIRYVVNGRQVRESTGSRNRKDAERLLSVQKAEAIQGRGTTRITKPLLFGSLVATFLQDLKFNRRTTMERSRISCQALS